jgi:imidazolonepropionase-like amidohydrolase
VHATWFRKALDAGVRMGLGSDIRPLKDAALLEMGLWVRDGATPWQTLVAATRHGAAVCGVGAELGTVEVGKLADLIGRSQSARGHYQCPAPADGPETGSSSVGQAASEWSGDLGHDRRRSEATD